MKKWYIGLSLCFLVFALIVWQSDDEVQQQVGFEQKVESTKKQNASVANVSPVRSKNEQSVQSQKPNEVAIALDKTIDSRVAAKFEPKNRTPSSLGNYFTEEVVRLGKRSYFISHELRSMNVEAYEASMGKEVFRQNGHVFFEAAGNNIGRPTLLNQRNRSIALLTGRIILKNIDLEKAKEIAQKQGSVLDESMAHLGIFAFESGSNVLETVNDLGVSISEAEIFEGSINEK